VAEDSPVKRKSMLAAMGQMNVSVVFATVILHLWRKMPVVIQFLTKSHQLNVSVNS
jgi:hypothetical protein